MDFVYKNEGSRLPLIRNNIKALKQNMQSLQIFLCIAVDVSNEKADKLGCC